MLKMIGDTGKNAVRREMPRQCHGLHGCTRNDNCLACKQAVNEGMQVSIEEGVAIEEKLFGACFETHDQVEGMACFLSREKPKPKAVFTNN